jgi:hypothetical protein
MVNYNNGKIYKIEALNGEEGDIYIGSTTKELLSQRMSKHRSDYKRWLNGISVKITSYILFEKYGVDNCRIVLIENVNANSSDELKAREAFYIKSMKCVNKNIPLRTYNEWYIDNIEKMKEYRIDNIEKIKEYKKLYVEKNKKTINEYNKLYRDQNREQLNENRRNKRKQKKLLATCETLDKDQTIIPSIV